MLLSDIAKESPGPLSVTTEKTISKGSEVGTMTDGPLNQPSTVTQSTRAAFLQYLHDNPNSHRVSQAEKENLIQWL